MERDSGCSLGELKLPVSSSVCGVVVRVRGGGGGGGGGRRRGCLALVAILSFQA